MILRRYVLTRVLTRTLFVLVAGTLLHIVIDIMAVSQQLARGSLGQILLLYALKLPEFALTLLPIAITLGPLLAMGSLAKRYEMAAVKFTGGTMRRVVAPTFVAVGLIAAGMHLTLTELIIPQTASRAVLMQHKTFNLRGPRFWNYYYPRKWMRTPAGFLHASSIQADTLSDVTYVQHNTHFQPILLLRAQRLEPREQGYFLINGVLTDIAVVGQPTIEFDELPFPEALAANALAQQLGYPEIFSIQELRRTIAVHGAQGSQVIPFKLEFWRRHAVPVILMMMVFSLVPVAAWARRGQPTERRLVEGTLFIGAFFMLRGVFAAAASLSDTACAIAAFGPAVVFAAVGIVLWRRIEHERFLTP
jgi:lipopolysaccharide export system permease protein